MRRLLTPGVVLALAAACSAGGGDSPTDPGGAGVSCSNPPGLPASGSVSGSVGGSKPCDQPNGAGQGYPYTLTLAQPANLELAVATSAFSPYLGIFTAAGDLVTESNSTTNRSVPLRARLFLAPGSYRIWVGSIGGSGAYTLTSAPTALDGCSTPGLGAPPYADQGNAVKGVTITGSVTSTDCSSPPGTDNARFDVYVVHLKAGATLNVSATVDRAATVQTGTPSGWTNIKPITGAGTWTTAVTATSTGYQILRIQATTVPVAYTVILN